MWRPGLWYTLANILATPEASTLCAYLYAYGGDTPSEQVCPI